VTVSTSTDRSPAVKKPDALQSSVVEILRNAIVRGDLYPGEKLAETRIALQLGVSRTPVREAFKQLQAEGLVSVVSRSGTFVTQLSPEDVAQLYDVREALEGMVARLAATAHAKADLRLLQANIRRTERTVKDHDRFGFIACDVEFHRLLTEATKNGKLGEHVAYLENRIQRERLAFLVTGRSGRIDRSYGEHQRVFEAVQAGDPDWAERAMREHVQRGREELVSALREQDRSRQLGRRSGLPLSDG
jgi:DNA-binding GntR family transcriptional regulator